MTMAPTVRSNDPVISLCEEALPQSPEGDKSIKSLPKYEGDTFLRKTGGVGKA